MARSRADRLAEALSLLEKAHGKCPRVKSEILLDQLVALLLAKAAPPDRAVKALKLLGTEFVDWNEVRISYVREVAEVLGAAGFESPEDAARMIISVFAGLYRDHNMVSLDFLAGVEHPPDALKQLTRIDAVDDGIAAAIASQVLPEPAFLQMAEVLRVPTRLGLAGKGASPSKVRKVLEDVAAGPGRLRAHYHFARLASEVCRSRVPLCAECPLLLVCDHGQKAVEPDQLAEIRKGVAKARGRPPGKKPPARKKRTTARRAAVGKKAPAAKKPAAKKPAAKKKAAGKTATKKKTAARKAGSRKPTARKAKKKR